MNGTQFNLIAKKLIKSTVQREAVYQSTMCGLPPSEAEEYAYGRKTNTVGREVKRIQSEYAFAHSVVSAQ